MTANCVKTFNDGEYSNEWLVVYRSVEGFEKNITIAGIFSKDTSDHEIIKPGHRFQHLSEDLKEINTWEVACIYKYKPEQEYKQAFDGIIVCGCKLISSTPVN